jgi:radical SAM protein with 4Fe4S-binding SPASM domain
MYSPFRYASSILFKRRPIHLTFFITRKCNAACPYCFYLESTNPTNPDIAELSLDEIRKIAASTGRLMWLAFSGGEIFLRRDLFEISQCFYDNCRPSIMLFPTNGLMPGLIVKQVEKILASCRNSVVVVKLSLDGIGKDHDNARKTPGNFDKVLDTCNRLSILLDRYPNFELGVNTTLHSENQADIEEIIEYVSNMDGISTHTVSLVRGSLKAAAYKRVDPDRYRLATNLLNANLLQDNQGIYRFRGARIKAAQDILQRRLIHKTLTSDEKSIPCYAGKLNLVLTEGGDVYPCEIMPHSFGNVREHGYDLLQVARTGEAEKIKKSISNANHYCKSCTHECNYMMNILFNPALYPALLKEYFRI